MPCGKMQYARETFGLEAYFCKVAATSFRKFWIDDRRLLFIDAAVSGDAASRARY
jgi:hypothetical protein